MNISQDSAPLVSSNNSWGDGVMERSPLGNTKKKAWTHHVIDNQSHGSCTLMDSWTSNCGRILLWHVICVDWYNLRKQLGEDPATILETKRFYWTTTYSIIINYLMMFDWYIVKHCSKMSRGTGRICFVPVLFNWSHCHIQTKYSPAVFDAQTPCPANSKVGSCAPTRSSPTHLAARKPWKALGFDGPSTAKASSSQLLWYRCCNYLVIQNCCKHNVPEWCSYFSYTRPNQRCNIGENSGLPWQQCYKLELIDASAAVLLATAKVECTPTLSNELQSPFNATTKLTLARLKLGFMVITCISSHHLIQYLINKYLHIICICIYIIL